MIIKNIQINELRNIIKQVINEEILGSDGGYYSNNEDRIIVSREEANFINKTIEEFKKDILSLENGIVVNNTPIGKINSTIINDMKQNHIKFEYENDEGTDFYYLAPNQNMEDVIFVLENAWQLFYDRIK